MNLRFFGETLIVALIYLALARLGQMAAAGPGIVGPIWPAAGFALAAVWYRGNRACGGIWLGNFAANVWVLLESNAFAFSPATTLVALAIGPGEVLQAALVALLIRRFCAAEYPLRRVADVLFLTAAQGGVGLVSSAWAVLWICGGGLVPWTGFGNAWLTWFLGGTVGVLTLAPALISLSKAHLVFSEWRKVLEAVALLAGGVAVAALDFTELLPFLPSQSALLFLTLLPILIAAFRFGELGVAWVVLVMGAVAILGTASGYGPFVSGGRNQSLLLLQLFLGTGTVTGLSISASLFERSQSLKDLSVTQTRLQHALRSANVGVWDWNTATDEVYVSPQLTVQLGYGPENTWSGFQDWLDALHPDDRDEAYARVQDYLQGRIESYTSTFRLQHKDGGYRWILSQGRTFCDEEGDLRFIGVHIDITERKEREDKLAELSEIVASSGDAIIGMSLENRITSWNRAAERLFGYTTEEAMGQSIWMLIPDAYHEQARERLAKVRSGEEVTTLDTVRRRKDGELVDVSLTISPIRDADGNQVGSSAIARDITARKRAERRLQLTVEASPTALVMVDREGRITLVNTQSERLFGYRREELIGEPIGNLVPEGLGEAVAEMHRDRNAKSGEPSSPSIGLTGVDRHGKRFPLQVGLGALEMDDEPMVLCGLADITKQKQAVEALEEAKRAAEAANEAKSTFLANMSHEIRTPMNAIIGMTELVLDTELDDTQREYLNLVLQSGESLLTIINEVLDFAKIEAGRFEMVSEPFLLREQLGDAVKSLSIRAHRKGLELAYYVKPDVPDALFGDAARLQQVIVNLVGNAIKFTDQGEVIVRVSCGECLHDRAQLHFSVADTGIGVPRQQQAAIFEAFSQADASASRRYGGTGLGLAITTKIVESMGGRIWVESEENEGSIFHFTAFFRRDLQAPETRSRAATQAPAYSVLVVEDNHSVRGILVEILHSWGTTAVAARDAAEAAAALQRHEQPGEAFDAVVLDAELADAELAGRLLNADRKPLPVVLLIGADPNRAASNEKAFPAALRILKPVKPSELLEGVLAAVEGSKAAVETEDRKPGSGGEETTPPGPSLKILLVEDALVNQRLALELLTKWGHDVSVANNGEQAVDAVAREPFDLVLMDVQMPEMDGLEATRLIRQQEEGTGRHVPIIAMTARALKGDRERCLQAGMDSYLPKPVRMQQLHEALQPYYPDLGETAQEETPSAADCELNWETALEIVGGDRSILARILETLLSECPEVMDRLEGAFRLGDAGQVESVAHTLRGSWRFIGADSLQQLCGRIETLAEEGDLPACESHFRELKQRVAQLTPALEAFVSEQRDRAP